MDNLFKTRTLVTSINTIKTVQTKIIDTVFAQKMAQANSRFAWDLNIGSETIMRNLKAYEPATVVNKLGRATVTCEAPRFSEKRLITKAEIENMRAYGQQTANELMSSRIANEQLDMRNKIDRTREFMAAKALGGQITDEYGNVLVDYNFVGDHKPVLGVGVKWNEAGGDPLMNIRAWQKLISQKVGVVTQWISFCGFDAMTALMNNEKVMALMQYQRGAQIADAGAVSSLAGVNISQYFGTYRDKDGVDQEFIPADKFILIGMTPGSFAELFAPAVHEDARGEMFFSKSWSIPDPDGRYILVESRPLPVIFRPECIVYADVV